MHHIRAYGVPTHAIHALLQQACDLHPTWHQSLQVGGREHRLLPKGEELGALEVEPKNAWLAYGLSDQCYCKTNGCTQRTCRECCERMKVWGEHWSGGSSGGGGQGDLVLPWWFRGAWLVIEMIYQLQARPKEQKVPAPCESGVMREFKSCRRVFCHLDFSSETPSAENLHHVFSVDSTPSNTGQKCNTTSQSGCAWCPAQAQECCWDAKG